MPLVELNREPTPKQVRLFATLGLPLGCVCAAAWAWHFAGPTWSSLLLGLAVLTLLIGRLRPDWFRPLLVVGVLLSFPLAWLLSWVLLAAVFFLLITPIGLIMRLVRGDPLARGFDREAKSYWTTRPGEVRDRARYFRQY